MLPIVKIWFWTKNIFFLHFLHVSNRLIKVLQVYRFYFRRHLCSCIWFHRLSVSLRLFWNCWFVSILSYSKSFIFSRSLWSPFLDFLVRLFDQSIITFWSGVCQVKFRLCISVFHSVTTLAFRSSFVCLSCHYLISQEVW